MNQKECSYRSLPWASELVWFPITVTTAFLHYITYPLGLEKLISGLVVGGFFGMILIPISLCGGIVYLLENSHILPPNFVWIAAQLLAIPFSIYYVVSILILNRQHLSVKDANCHPTNRNFIESASSKFLFSFQDYLQMTCVPWSSDAKLLPNKQYVIAVHPHGIHCTPLALFSTVGSSFDMRFPNLVGQKLTGLAATIMFKIPLVRELFLNMGYVDASRCVASKVLEEGRSLYVCTGGEEESMYTTPGKDTVVLKRRKGFVRLALSYGAELVPVFGVGNNDLYTTYKFLLGPRLWIQKNFGIALPLFHGRWGTPIPHKRQVRVLIGKPIPTPKPKVMGAKPDNDLVDEYHAKYVSALIELHSNNVKDRILEIR